MTPLSLDNRFEAINKLYMKFEGITAPRSKRPDLHAFLLLDELFPGERDLICAAEHDIFYLDISEEDLERVTLTDSQIEELVRCGVMYTDGEGFSMFA